MNQVDGVYSKMDCERVEGYLRAYYPQVALFWLLGVETGYRVSDILRLRVKDIQDGRICVLEGKTGKLKTVYVSDITKNKIITHVRGNGLKNDAYIFGDREGVNPLTRQHIWRVIKKAGQAVGLPCL
jgi:integrase